MKIEIIISNDKVAGYKFIRENDSDAHEIELIRAMHFMGMDDQVIVYGGRKTDETHTHTMELEFRKKWYDDQKEAEYNREFMRKFSLQDKK